MFSTLTILLLDSTISHEASLRIIHLVEEVLNFWPLLDSLNSDASRGKRYLMDWCIALTTSDEGMVHLHDRLQTAHELLGFNNPKEASTWVQNQIELVPALESPSPSHTGQRIFRRDPDYQKILKLCCRKSNDACFSQYGFRYELADGDVISWTGDTQERVSRSFVTESWPS
jgi:hypothetical protein